MTNPRLEPNLKIKQQLSERLPDFMSKYIIELEATGTTLNSQIAFLRQVEKFLLFITEKNITQYKEDQLKDITTFDISKYLSECKNKGNTNSTVATKYTILKHWIDFLRNNEIISKNLFKSIKKPTFKQRDIESFTKEDIVQMFKKVDEDQNELTNIRDKAILATLLYSGIRISELVGMDISDIDLKNKTIKVVRKGDEEDIVDTVRCSQEWLPYIEDWLSYRELQVETGKISKDTKAVFISNKSGRLNKAGVSSRINIHTGGHAHMFRKTFGQHLYEATGDIYLTAEALGHRNVENTKKYYVKVNLDIKNNAIDNLNFGN